MTVRKEQTHNLFQQMEFLQTVVNLSQVICLWFINEIHMSNNIGRTGWKWLIGRQLNYEKI